MMKRFTMALILMPLVAPAYAEYYDPMQPPAYALQKMKAAKAAKNPQRGKPPVDKAARVEPWVLSSILYSPGRKHAIINNQVVRKGEVIRGARLVRLQPDAVRLQLNDRYIDLSLRKGNGAIKKSSQGRKI